MTAIVSLGRTRAAFHPALTGPCISLETRFIAEKQFHLFIMVELGEFDDSATKHQEYGVEALGSLLVGATGNSHTQLWDGAVFSIWVMTLAADA